MEEMQARLSALSDDMAMVKHEKGKLKRSYEEQSRSAKPKGWKLTEPMRRTVLAIHYLADYDPEPAVRYLQARSRQHQWRPRKSDEEVATIVENLFMSSDEGEGAALSDLTSPESADVCRKALKDTEEWRVVKWARACNEQTSVAPSSAHMLDRMEENRLNVPEASRLQPAGNVSMSSARSRVHRIRKRWGGSCRATPVGVRVDPEEARGKVFLSIQLIGPGLRLPVPHPWPHRRPRVGIDYWEGEVSVCPPGCWA